MLCKRESCLPSSVITHLRVSTCVLLIYALKRIENCQSGEISFAVGRPNEWVQVCQMDCGKSTCLGRGHSAKKTWTQFRVTLCNDISTLECHLMLQNRLCQFNDLVQPCNWNSTPYWLCEGLHQLWSPTWQIVSRPGVLLSSWQVNKPVIHLLSVVLWNVFVTLFVTTMNLNESRRLMAAIFLFLKTNTVSSKLLEKR